MNSMKIPALLVTAALFSHCGLCDLPCNPSAQKVLAAENTCMNTEEYSEDYIFNAPLNGVISGVELVYSSGELQCADGVTEGASKWGCSDLFYTNFLKMGSSGNTVLYPTLTMDLEVLELVEIASCSPGDCGVELYMTESSVGPQDDILLLSDPLSPYTVTTDDQFSLQYSYGCCYQFAEDNTGTVCADIYFVYDSVVCENEPDVLEPTLDPTINPTLRPSLAPTYTVCDTADALNIAFLLDESGSIDFDEWEVVKTFVNRLVTFDISPESYVSLFEYATQESYENFMNWTKNDDVGKPMITDAMTNNRWNAAGQTYTWWGTSKVLDAFWNYRKSCRDDSCTRQDMLFIITDGAPSDDVCPNIAARMAGSDVDVVLIIIGGDGADDADAIEAKIGCLDKDGTDILKVNGVDSDEFNAIEVFIRGKTCSGSYSAGSEVAAGPRYQYCPPDDPVSACTYDLGLGSNVGTGGAGGALDAGASEEDPDAAHAQFGQYDVDGQSALYEMDAKFAADNAGQDGIVIVTWWQILSIGLVICAVIVLAISICACVAKMQPKSTTNLSFNGDHVQVDCESTESDEPDDEES